MILKSVVCLGFFTSICLGNELLDYEISAEEIDENIERPCRIFDMFCIREYFVKHARCKEAFGPTPSPLYKAQSNIYLPRVNMGINSVNGEYSELSTRVSEFYINKKTDKLLLAVEYTDLKFGSNENYYRFFRKGTEPVVTRDSFNATFPNVVLTITIPKLNDLQLQDSETFAYSNSLIAIITVGPNTFIAPDPQDEPFVLKSLTEFVADVPSDVIEGFLTEANFLIASFIKYNICDFGFEIL